jgi:hypothetical protein
MFSFLALMMQADTTPSMTSGQAAMTGAMIGLWLGIVVVMIAALWKVFQKAGKPGWAAIVPIYNVLVLLEITGKPMWWVVLFFIPFVNLIVAIILLFALARSFGKGGGFAIGLLLLPPIFYSLLAWGSARYTPQPQMA